MIRSIIWRWFILFIRAHFHTIMFCSGSTNNAYFNFRIYRFFLLAPLSIRELNQYSFQLIQWPTQRLLKTVTYLSHSPTFFLPSGQKVVDGPTPCQHHYFRGDWLQATELLCNSGGSQQPGGSYLQGKIPSWCHQNGRHCDKHTLWTIRSWRWDSHYDNKT